jgi:excisionase family DNA binding protein
MTWHHASVDDNETLIPIKEACSRLGGITRPTLYKLIGADEIRSVTIGRRRLIPASQIDEYITRKLATP